MQSFPHTYNVTATGEGEGAILVRSAGLPVLATAAPAEFDGPGDLWSPETMLVAAAANCFILTFRAIARASQFPWQQLHCQATGLLDRIDRVTRFTEIRLAVTLWAPSGTNEERARRLLEKAEQGCLITNSLTAKITLNMELLID
jgi:peroxiredoxin-like protein